MTHSTVKLQEVLIFAFPTMTDEPEMNGDDLVRQTDLLIQQLAAARASSGVPASPSTSVQHHDGYSIPNEVTIGLPPGGDEGEDEDESAGKTDHGTLSTADVTGDAYQDDDGGDGSSTSSDGGYQDAVQESTSSDDDGGGIIQPGPQDLDYLAQVNTHRETQTSAKPVPTALRAKIMEKYGREGSSSNVIGGSQHQIPSSITKSSSSQSKKKKKTKADKKKRKEGSASSGRKKRESGSGKSATVAHGYGADYTPSMSTSAPAPVLARTPSTRPAPTAIPTTPQIYAGGYQGTPNESLQEAMKQAEIAEDAARRMREAVSIHQMDRDGVGGMAGFGSSGPGRYGPSPNPVPSSARVGASFLETGATACIRELLSCLADPLAALAGDNAAPAGSSVTGFGGMEDPHPRWARASGRYEYVEVPNIGHTFGGGGAPSAAAAAGGGSATNISGRGLDEGHADEKPAGTGKHESERQQNDRSDDATSERKGLLSGTGYDSNW